MGRFPRLIVKECEHRVSDLSANRTSERRILRRRAPWRARQARRRWGAARYNDHSKPGHAVAHVRRRRAARLDRPEGLAVFVGKPALVGRVTKAEIRDLGAEGARVLWRLGRFKELASALAQRHEPWALIERGRLAFFHDSDPSRSCELLSEALKGTASSEERLICRSLLDVVGSSLGHEPNGIDPAEFAECHPDVVSEALYFTAMALYMRNEYSSSRTWLRSHTPKNPAFRARFALLEGFLAAAADGDLHRQAELTDHALAILEAEAPDERYLIVSSAETLAYLLRELRLDVGRARLHRLIDGADWKDGFADPQFQVLRTLAWCHALDADYYSALVLLEKASVITRSPLMRAYLHLDYSGVAVFSGATMHATASFHIADKYIQGLDFATAGRAHAALLPLAAQTAAEANDLPRAKEYCNLAEIYRPQIARNFNLAHGPRIEAMIAEASALSYCSDDPARSINDAKYAYSIFSQLGYQWRSGRMALLLHQITRKTQWRDHAIEQLSSYPKSPFHRMLSLGTTRRTLTSQQQRILTLLQRGYSTQRIAGELGRSPDTIRIHIGRLHRQFGVKNRHELLASLAHEAVAG